MSRPLFNQSHLAAAITLAAAGLVATPASAQNAPAYAIAGSGFFGNDSSVTVGFIFTATQNVALTALGFHDQQLNGLANAHDIGLFSTSGTLLASATVAAGTAAPLIGEYRYVDLASAFTLLAGTSYVLAAHTFGADGYRYGGAATLSLDPRLTVPAGAGVHQYGTGLNFPNTVYYDFYATPNMLLAAAVPEPGTWALMIAGLAAVTSIARRRQA